MSIHYEWLGAGPWTSVKFVPDGYDLTTGEPADEDTHDMYLVDGGGAIVFSSDDVVVVQGTPARLRDLLNRALAALPEEES
jgi:hypothetical protein